jgi:predicted ArsR family transcriptional regulator
MEDARTARVTAVAALAEPTRRRLYDVVSRSAQPMSRDDVAGATGVPRATTAFHLDRLVVDGLLEISFERRTGRSGPGAGRPAKLYRRADCAVEVSFPERHYDLAGDLLAGAMAAAEDSGEPPRAALARLAYARGRRLGEGATAGDGRAAALAVLEQHGFEPHLEDGAIGLANCPFHALTQEHTELVCGMNLRLLEGVLDGIPDAGLVASLRPGAGRCCVQLDPPGADEGAR